MKPRRFWTFPVISERDSLLKMSTPWQKPLDICDPLCYYKYINKDHT